jgi:hypothetical protein
MTVKRKSRLYLGLLALIVALTASAALVIAHYTREDRSVPARTEEQAKEQVYAYARTITAALGTTTEASDPFLGPNPCENATPGSNRATRSPNSACSTTPEEPSPRATPPTT